MVRDDSACVEDAANTGSLYKHSNFIEDDEKLNEFDDILTRVGFGRYQIMLFIIVGVIGMCDAGESQALSLVLPILENEWGINDFQESLMGSLVYAGYFVGSIGSGLVADQYGRKLPIFYVSGLMFITAIIGAFMPNFILYTIFRVLLVACVGFITPIAYTMLAENTPIKQRGVVLIVIGFFYTLGELTVCLLAYIFMPSLVSGNWRAVLAWASLPAGIVFVITLIFIYESPRFLLLKDKSDKAMEVMIKIASKNRTSRDLHSIPIETYQFISYQLIQQEIDEQGTIDSKNVFKQSWIQMRKLLKIQFRLITLIVWTQWFVSSMVFAGITFLLPLTLKDMNQEDKEDSQDLLVITYSVLGELPTLFIAAIMVNIKILGRKNSLAIAYLLCAVFTILIQIIQTTNLLFSLLIAGSKLSINLAFSINYEFTSEVYPTYMRASGVGLASSVGKIGSIIMPWLVIYISRIGIFLPYSIFSGFAFLAFVLTLFLPFDTYQRELDKKQ